MSATATSSADETTYQVADDEDGKSDIPGIHFVDYKDESQLDHVMELVGRDLSEPYSSASLYQLLLAVCYLCIVHIREQFYLFHRSGCCHSLGIAMLRNFSSLQDTK
jgi:hypothetical protein